MAALVPAISHRTVPQLTSPALCDEDPNLASMIR
jgi:hypothetical protein